MNENVVTELRRILLFSESNHLKLSAAEALTQITSSMKILNDAEVSIQELISRVHNTEQIHTNDVAEITKEIKNNRTLKERLILALKAGGQEVLRQIIPHPFAQLYIETIKGFLEEE